MAQDLISRMGDVDHGPAEVWECLGAVDQVCMIEHPDDELEVGAVGFGPEVDFLAETEAFDACGLDLRVDVFD